MRDFGTVLFWGTLALHFVLVTVATLGFIGHAVPFYTTLTLCLLLLARDQTVFFAYPGLLLMTVMFLAPLIVSDVPIAVKTFRGHNFYDNGLILSFYWFIGFFSCYLPSANAVREGTVDKLQLTRSDVVPILASMCLLVFSALMLRDGTLLSGGYRDVTADRLGFIEFAALLSLMGFCAVRSRLVRTILIACVAVYLISCLLVGLRLRFLSVATVAFCCMVGMKIDPRWKMAGFAAAILLFVLGMVRNTGLADANLASLLSFEQLYKRGAVVSTPGGAFQTAKFYSFYVDTIAPIQGGSAFYFLIGDFLSIFLTKGGIPANMEIKRATTAYFDVPGGGLLPGYFFAYFGVFGAVVLSAVFSALFIAILRLRMAGAFPYQVLLAAYAPRTLLYDWTVGFKMMFFFFVLNTILTMAARAAPDRSSVARTAEGRP
ncbi:MAG: hypothetical protein AAF501_06445 [Pseudomonadota bacterium]